jgi:hypothetical protein
VWIVAVRDDDNCCGSATWVRFAKIGAGGARAQSRRAQSGPLAVIPIHDVKQRSVVRSRGALLRPGFCPCDRVHPNEGWQSADRRTREPRKPSTEAHLDDIQQLSASLGREE